MVRIAVVGVGYLGRHHARLYHAVKDARLMAVVDSDEMKAKQAGESYGVPWFKSAEDLPASSIDGVSIATPNETHFELAKMFLQAGKHVLLEKPMTRTIEEANVLEAIAASKGLILQVGHLERFNPAVRAIGDLVKNPGFIESHRLSPFILRGIHVDVILEVMIHDIDIILSLFRSEVIEVRAAGIEVLTRQIDIANARLEFANGCIANLTASRVSAEKVRKLRIFQPDTYISLDYNEQRVDYYKLLGEKGKPETRIEKGLLPIQKKEPLQIEIESFIHCILEKKPPLVGPKEAKDAMRVGFAILKDIKKRKEKHFKSF